jgi:hypothetical protein
VLPHGGIDYTFLYENRDKLTEAANKLTDKDTSVPLASLGVLLNYAYIPINGINGLIKDDLQTRSGKLLEALDTNYYTKLNGTALPDEQDDDFFDAFFNKLAQLDSSSADNAI